jgi:adenosylcobinamide hydrolase
VSDGAETTIPDIRVAIDGLGVTVRSERLLWVLSSAVVGGGFCCVRDIVNMHVDDMPPGTSPEQELFAYAGRLGIGGPFVGVMTAAETQYAQVAAASRDGLTVAAVVSVGLSNTTSAGVSEPVAGADGASGLLDGVPDPSDPGAVNPGAVNPGAVGPGTINTILLVDGQLTPAALVNAVITVTEAKTMVLGEWQVRTAEGQPASGTSTDSVVVAATGRGPALRYAGPATTVGWLAARTTRQAIERICAAKLARDGGRRIGW